MLEGALDPKCSVGAELVRAFEEHPAGEGAFVQRVGDHGRQLIDLQMACGDVEHRTERRRDPIPLLLPHVAQRELAAVDYDAVRLLPEPGRDCEMDASRVYISEVVYGKGRLV